MIFEISTMILHTLMHVSRKKRLVIWEIPLESQNFGPQMWFSFSEKSECVSCKRSCYGQQLEEEISFSESNFYSTKKRAENNKNWLYYN